MGNGIVYSLINIGKPRVARIDSDISGLNRDKVLNHLRKVYGQDRMANVLTLRTEKPKSAIQACCRGLGIDVDIANYLASLIPCERGQLWSLNDCMYGNEAEDRKPVEEFVKQMTENYPEIWRVVQKTEGLIVGYGTHAGGIVFVDEPFVESTALMRAPNDVIETQFELHTLENCSLIKYDILSVEAIDKIQICLNLLIENGYIEKESTLRKTYEKAIGIYNLERNDPNMWRMVWEHQIPSLFQMDSQAGGHGIDLIHPKNVTELATLNSVIRLMAPDKGTEQPLETWARYRSDISQWIKEMHDYGLADEDIKWLCDYPDLSDGIAEAQEALMKLTMEERLGGNTLMFADKCRKALAKKVGKLFVECEETFYNNAKEKNCNMTLVHYVWDVLLRMQRSYAFNKSHTLAYSLVALQEMNLAFRFPLIFWNCACLISDAGGLENEADEDNEDIKINSSQDYYNELPEFNEGEENKENSYYEEDCDGYPSEVVITTEGKKKKITKVTNFGKIATAIGKLQSCGVTVTSPDINRSQPTFTPDAQNNVIRFGLSGISKINEELIQNIINNRPYMSIKDFLQKVKINKAPMINLIKAGAFDSFGDRMDIMYHYITSISDLKKDLNLRNVQMLIKYQLIDSSKEFYCKVFNFNKYLKTAVDGIYYLLDDVAYKFYSANFDINVLEISDQAASGFAISIKVWDKIYNKQIDVLRKYIAENKTFLLEKLNMLLIQETMDKYCKGNISQWEMDAISCYIHNHELINFTHDKKYNIEDFFALPSEAEIDRYLNFKNKQIPIFKLHRITGTVLDRDKSKQIVTLLTPTGVVNVKVYGAFKNYDRQISIKNSDGTKTILRKSEFCRGNKLIITGIKTSDDTFMAKKYRNTPYNLIDQIIDIQDTKLIIDHREFEDA